MTDTPDRPTAEQYRDLRSFLKTREREAELERRNTGFGPHVDRIHTSWVRLAVDYVNAADPQRAAERPAEVAHAWTTLLDLVRPWADSPLLPDSLRPAVTARATWR